MLINRLAHRSTVALLKDVQHDVCDVDATRTSTCGAATWHLLSCTVCIRRRFYVRTYELCYRSLCEHVSRFCVCMRARKDARCTPRNTHTTAIIFSALEGEERLTVVPSIFLSYIYTFSVPFHYFFQFEKLNINALRARLNQHISSTWMIFFFSLARHLRFCIYRFVCCVVAERARNKQRCVTDQIEQLKVN